MIPVLLGGTTAAVWLVLRALAPGIPFRLPAVAAFLWRYLLPASACVMAGWQRPWVGLILAAAVLLVLLILRRLPATLRREVAAAVAVWRASMARAPQPATFEDVALQVLLQRYGRRGISHLEAVTLAGRSHGVDELAAQIALRDGGLGAYGAYLRRFGQTTEVQDPETAMSGTPFPDSIP
ncbi:MAG: hypothetical protein O7D35_11945 [Acidobacteria bacterium]|nr:hypothetical protein [Acidobacteriota bacterium]MCZ6651367.1 hypothetical protein [Acidobacteriota bacterium]